MDVETTDRRRTSRHPARDNRARLEWAEGAEFQGTEARIVDISQGGARFVADEAPPADRQVWLRLEMPALTGWVSAKVIRLDESLGAGLAFCGYCPFDLFRAATSGGGFGLD